METLLKKQELLLWLSKMISWVRVSFFLLAIVFSISSKGQDAVFSQFYNSTLYLNPAMAGIEDDLTISLSHRSQWRSLVFPYTTSQFSLIVPYYKSKHSKPLGHLGGVGLSIFNDVAGENSNFKTTGANGAFAYNLPLDRKHVNQITFGLQVGLINKRIDASNLQWGEQYNPYVGFDASIAPTEVNNFQNRTFFDVNFGVFYWLYPIQDGSPIIKSINSGLSVSHLNHPNESLLEEEESRLPVLYKYHGGILFNLNPKAMLSLNLLSALQDQIFQHNIGVYLSYKLTTLHQEVYKYVLVRVGSWVRLEDSAIVLTEFETKLFKVGFSYDWNTSSLRYNDRGIGTYEVHLSIRLSSHAPAKTRY